jgi:hypothetical protein
MNAWRATEAARRCRAVVGRSALKDRKIGAKPSGLTIGSSAARMNRTAFV